MQAIVSAHPVEASIEEGAILSREEILSKPPTAAFEGSSYWLIEKTAQSSSGFGMISGCLPLHFHTDGEHRLTFLSGKLLLRVGSAERTVGPGDYARIPPGVPHKLTCLGGEPVWFATFDSPPMDPTNFHWLEEAPKRVEGCPFCPTPKQIPQ